MCAEIEGAIPFANPLLLKDRQPLCAEDQFQQIEPNIFDWTRLCVAATPCLDGEVELRPPTAWADRFCGLPTTTSGTNGSSVTSVSPTSGFDGATSTTMVVTTAATTTVTVIPTYPTSVSSWFEAWWILILIIVFVIASFGLLLRWYSRRKASWNVPAGSARISDATAIDDEGHEIKPPTRRLLFDSDESPLFWDGLELHLQGDAVPKTVDLNGSVFGATTGNDTGDEAVLMWDKSQDDRYVSMTGASKPLDLTPRKPELLDTSLSHPDGDSLYLDIIPMAMHGLDGSITSQTAAFLRQMDEGWDVEAEDRDRSANDAHC